MKDKWMNLGYEEDELKPYLEPEPDFKDLKRIGMTSGLPINLLSSEPTVVLVLYEISFFNHTNCLLNFLFLLWKTMLCLFFKSVDVHSFS